MKKILARSFKYLRVFLITLIVIFSTLYFVPSSRIPLAILYIYVGSIIYDGNEDVSHDEKFSHLVNHSFKLKKDLFYFEYPDTKEKALDVASSSLLPASIKDYENDPENWMNTDANAKKGHGPEDGYMKFKVYGVVKKGTLLTIERIILEKKFVAGNTCRYIATIEEGPFKGEKVNVFYLLDGMWDGNPRINEEILAENYE